MKHTIVRSPVHDARRMLWPRANGPACGQLAHGPRRPRSEDLEASIVAANVDATRLFEEATADGLGQPGDMLDSQCLDLHDIDVSEVIPHPDVPAYGHCGARADGSGDIRKLVVACGWIQEVQASGQGAEDDPALVDAWIPRDRTTGREGL